MGVVSDILFGKSKEDYRREYDKALQDTKQSRADAAYQYRYNKALYDANKDYFDKAGIKDPSASYWNRNGQRTNAYLDTMNQYGKYLNDLQSEKEKVMKQQKYNLFGSGLIGSILNPFHQAGTAAQDFVTSGTREWDRGNRDIISDLGAIGEVGLDLATLGSAAGAGAVAKTLPITIGKGATLGGLYGALGYIRESGKDDFNLGGLLGSAGIGAAMGGGLSGVGYGVNKGVNTLASRAANTRDLANAYQQYMNRAGNTGASRLLGDGAGGATAGTAYPQSATEQWLLNRGNLAKTRLGQAAQGAADTISYNKLVGNTPVSRLRATKLGNTASRLLKTKKGKVAAGVGGGLLLSRLMNGNNKEGE